MFIVIFQLKDKSANLTDSAATEVKDINNAISKSRDELSNQQSELRKSIETVAAKLRADNNTNLTNQVGHVRLIASRRPPAGTNK